ncbi:SRPBCC family protein [Aeromicrobium sp. Leaf350]|uniref:SRPBCC family protein n=1 Tax=Aeromicrobium sp. Leaf350 TaxID=2876565 RepID=UPI001E4D324D|nr:SRPBCC family protein [Aeromicrobium sp. Leaf350]
MTWFETSRTSEAVVTADRADVWAALVDPSAIAEMTPLVERIEADGDHWRWQLQNVPGLGVSIAPAFTVRLETDEPDRIAFVHDPPEGERERAGVEGIYLLSEVEQGTRLKIDLTVRVDLPLPRLTKPAVTTSMQGVLASMGKGFSSALLRRLGAEQLDV